MWWEDHEKEEQLTFLTKETTEFCTALALKSSMLLSPTNFAWSRRKRRLSLASDHLLTHSFRTWLWSVFCDSRVSQSGRKAMLNISSRSRCLLLPFEVRIVAESNNYGNYGYRKFVLLSLLLHWLLPSLSTDQWTSIEHSFFYSLLDPDNTRERDTTFSSEGGSDACLFLVNYVEWDLRKAVLAQSLTLNAPAVQSRHRFLNQC